MVQEGNEKLVQELIALLSQAPPLIESGLYDIALEIGCEKMFTSLMHVALARATQLLQAFCCWSLHFF